MLFANQPQTRARVADCFCDVASAATIARPFAQFGLSRRAFEDFERFGCVRPRGRFDLRLRFAARIELARRFLSLSDDSREPAFIAHILGPTP